MSEQASKHAVDASDRPSAFQPRPNAAGAKLAGPIEYIIGDLSNERRLVVRSDFFPTGA